LQHRAAAGAATENRNPSFAAGGDIALARNVIRVSDHDEVLLRFPET